MEWNSRFKRHHIERNEVRWFDTICACHFAVKSCCTFVDFVSLAHKSSKGRGQLCMYTTSGLNGIGKGYQGSR